MGAGEEEVTDQVFIGWHSGEELQLLTTISF